VTGALPPPRSGAGKKLAILAGLGIAAAAGTFLFLNARSGQAPISAAPVAGTELPAAASAQATKPPPSSAKVIDLDGDAVSPASPTSGAAITTAARPSAGKVGKGLRPVHAPTGAVPASKRARSGEDELDPGF
jgi:hypothetical protein